MTTTIPSRRDQALAKIEEMRSAQDDFESAAIRGDAKAVEEAVDRFKQAMLWLAENRVFISWDERGRPWLLEDVL